MAIYLALVYVFHWYREGKICFLPKDSILTRIFDSATFAGSIMLLWGIMDPTVLKALGDTKPFLIVAGVGGFIYCIHALGET
jgi:hypothetical protein